ncbi:MAG TPA: DUF2442 domain-containing protein [Anaerolineae bacterium]|jgi:hypothetical protein
MSGTPSVTVKLALPRLVSVLLNDDTLAADLEDGRTISVPISWYPRLAHATPAEQAHFETSGGGHGIYWPDLDEDISIEGMLLGRKSTESAASFERWLKKRHKV